MSLKPLTKWGVSKLKINKKIDSTGTNCTNMKLAMDITS
jgi:hypothetical protein